MSTSDDPVCENCLDVQGASHLYDVEILEPFTDANGYTAFAHSAGVWCGRCVSAAGHLGYATINGRTTYGIDRQPSAKPMRVRFAT